MDLSSSGSTILHPQLDMHFPQKKRSVCNQFGYCGVGKGSEKVFFSLCCNAGVQKDVQAMPYKLCQRQSQLMRCKIVAWSTLRFCHQTEDGTTLPEHPAMPWLYPTARTLPSTCVLNNHWCWISLAMSTHANSAKDTWVSQSSWSSHAVEMS